MNPLLSGILGVIVRASLVWLGSTLQAHGAAPDLVTRIASTDTEQQVIGWILIALPVVWSMRGQASHLREKLAANLLAPGATLAQIKSRAAEPDIKVADLPKS